MVQEIDRQLCRIASWTLREVLLRLLEQKVDCKNEIVHVEVVEVVKVVEVVEVVEVCGGVQGT